MKKAKKKLKGMTLFEIIISIAIFGMLGAVLILLGTHIDNSTKATTNLKNKIVEQSPYAANHLKSYKDEAGSNVPLETEELDIHIELHQNGTYYVAETNPANTAATTIVAKSYNSPTVDMKADKYKTDKIVGEDVLNDAQKAAKVNGNLNLEFFEIQPEVASTT